VFAIVGVLSHSVFHNEASVRHGIRTDRLTSQSKEEQDSLRKNHWSKPERTLAVGFCKVNGRQVLYFALRDTESNVGPEARDGADRNGDLFTSPKMPLL